MADFEGLINQALAKQDSADPSIRERVYQSSRNALVKMLEKTGIVSDEAVRHHFEKLETSIALIEARYNPPPMAVPEEQRDPTPDLSLSKPLEEPVAPQIFEEQAPRVEQAPAAAPISIPVTQSPVHNEQQPATPNAEPDIIDELEALLPSTYKPEPLFPSVSTAKTQQQPAPPAPNSAPSSPTAPPTQPVRSEQIPAAAPAAPSPQARPEQPIPQASQAPSRPAEPVFEDDFAIPEKVNAYLGDVAQDDVRADTFDYDDAPREPVHVYKRKNPLLRRIWPIFIAIAVVLIILWILYALLANMPDSDMSPNSGVVLGPVGETQVAEDGSVFITLLEPTDLSALVTAGRGSAELITQQNQQILRLQSVRQGALTASGAEPILLELEKGVLNQISGKSITVELYAKSGQNGPAQFAIECDFAGDSICGRKRFRVGTQPERIVFALDLSAGVKQGERAYVAINTDITNDADSSGNGDAIDVIYVRLRLPDA